MPVELRVEINKAIREMEQGRFQDFCLAFLPAHDRSYKGLERFGHTAAGKTRKGTPDLLKTLDDGRQLAVQCSTEKSYWNKPGRQANYSKSWKPCRDLDDCLEKLRDPVEIVLCCNQEIPTNQPNAKAEILNYGSSKTKITILALEDFDQHLADNIETPAFKPIFEEFFPNLFALIQLEKDAQKYKIALEVLPLTSINIQAFDQIASQAIEHFKEFRAAQEYTLQEVDSIWTRYQRKELSEFKGLTRTFVETTLLGDTCNKITLLVGAPRIGKTSLLLDLAARWIGSGKQVAFFDASIPTPEDQKVFLHILTQDILARFLPMSKAREIALGRELIDENELKSFGQPANLEMIFIVDNAHHLHEEIVRRLYLVLRQLKPYLSARSVTVILSGNKDLSLVCPAIDKVLVSPAWTSGELGALLDLNSVVYDYENKKAYLEFLEIACGGHPVLALTLARRYSTTATLFVSRLINPPSLVDEDLSQEVKSLLYQDLLKNSDYQNFVQRLAVLIYPANSRVINTICRNISPVISTSPKVMIDYLGQAIIEGDENSGVYISPVFKEIAKQQISTVERTEVYNQVAETLLTPKDKVFDVKDIIDGIFYSLVANEIQRALFWTGYLLWNALRKPFTSEQLSYVVERIGIVAFIQAPQEPLLCLMHGANLFSFALAYSHLREHKKAANVLAQFKLPEKLDGSDEIGSELRTISEAIELFKIMELCFAGEYIAAAKELVTINIDVVTTLYEKLSSGSNEPELPLPDLFDLGADLLTMIPIQDVPEPLIRKLITVTNVHDDKRVSKLMSIASKVGLAVAKNGEPIEKINSLFNGESALYSLLLKMAEAEYLSEKGDTPSTLSGLTEAQDIMRKAKISGPLSNGRLLQIRADTLYLQDCKDSAKECYQDHLALIDDVGSFDYAWTQYRLGLLEEDWSISERRLSEASRAFASSKLINMLARCEGERATALVKLGRKDEFASIVEWMGREYYTNGAQEFGPVVTIGLAHLTRLVDEMTGTPPSQIEGGLILPEFEKGVYAGVLDAARPKGGEIAMLFGLARVYQALGLKEKEVDYLRRALAKSFDHPIDQALIPHIAHAYIKEVLRTADASEIARVMGIIISCHTCAINFNQPEYLSIAAFGPLDELLPTLAAERIPVIDDALKSLEVFVRSQNWPTIDFWLADVQWRKSTLLEHSNRKPEIARSWQRAYEYSLRGKNSIATIKSAHMVGFEFVECGESLRALAQTQWNLVLAVETQVKDLDRLETVGKNLFRTWRSIDFRRLSEYDLKAKKTLLDGAKALDKSGVSADDASPIMILLLGSLYDHEGESVKWALDHLVLAEEAIPLYVKKLITKYINLKSRGGGGPASS